MVNKNFSKRGETVMKVLINSGLVAPVFKKRNALINKMKLKNSVTVSGYEKEVEELCAKNGVNYEFISMSRAGISPIKDLKTLFSYYKLIKKNKYDIVHSYTAKPNIYGSIGARIAGCKQIYPTINGLGYAFTGNSPKNKIIRFTICFLYKIAFACATKVFFQNPDDANEMIKRKVISKEKCVVISGSGVDTNEYKFCELKRYDVFFLASRLLITKGLREYFEAAVIVKRKYPNVTFLLAGDFDPNPDGITKEELKKYTKSKTVEYLGVVNDMVKALQDCTVFVLPSYYREGIPHVVLEAMSVGRAILTTDSIGCRETINGKNGYLVKAKDAEDLAKKMILMIKNKVKTKQMGIESRKYVEQRFDVNIVNKIMLETMHLYEE